MRSAQGKIFGAAAWLHSYVKGQDTVRASSSARCPHARGAVREPTWTILAYSCSSSTDSLSRFSAAQRPMMRSVSSQPVWRERYSRARLRLATSASGCGPSDCRNLRGSNRLAEFVTPGHSLAPPDDSHAADVPAPPRIRAARATARAATPAPFRSISDVVLGQHAPKHPRVLGSGGWRFTTVWAVGFGPSGCGWRGGVSGPSRRTRPSMRGT